MHQNKYTYMNAGQYRTSSWVCRFSKIEVIMEAAVNAIFREGYAVSSGWPFAPFGCGVAGGMCALCNKHSVVLPSRVKNLHYGCINLGGVMNVLVIRVKQR